MHYILPTGSVARFDTLRNDYQEKRKIDLEGPQSAIGMPLFLGGTNVEGRLAQICFLEKIKMLLQPNLIAEVDMKSPADWQANLTASRIMIAACLYVQSQIPRPKNDSALYRIIDANLGITSHNYLDEADKEICNFAADRWISASAQALDEANAVLTKGGLNPFSEKEWRQFSKFIKKNCETSQAVNPYTNYPITSITQPLFGAVFAYTGATIGFLGGDVISHSTQAMSSRYKMTALVGSTLLVLGPAGPAGVALFAPVIAGKVITTFCSISLAHVLGVAMGILGQGVGLGVGLPLDLAYRLLWKACSVIGNQYNKATDITELSGIRIQDGMIVLAGIAVELTPESQLPLEYTKLSMEIKADGKCYVDVPQNPTASLGLSLNLQKEEKSEALVLDEDYEEMTGLGGYATPTQQGV